MLQKALNKDGSQLAAKIRALPRDFTVGDYFTGSGAFSKVVDGLFQALMEFFPQETSDLTVPKHVKYIFYLLPSTS